MVLSWVDLCIHNRVKPFSLGLEKGDFLFLAGETCMDKLLRALAGFSPQDSNSQDAIRVDGLPLKEGEKLDSLLLPRNMAQSFPPHRTIGQFALDIAPNRSKASLLDYAEKSGIDGDVLRSKPREVSLPALQKVSLWCASLFASAAVFIEEPEGGFCEECRPFDFLQGMLVNGITNSIVYSPSEKDSVLEKSRAMQLCRARIAVFCADRLAEEGEAARILQNPIHDYTKEWINEGGFKDRKAGALWSYCPQHCEEKHCPRQNIPASMWDCESRGLHKVICREFI